MQQTNSASSINEASSINLLDYLHVLVKGKKIIVISTVAFALAAAAYSLSLPNVYTATTLIVAGDDDKGSIAGVMAQFGGLASLAGGTAFGAPTKVDLYITMLGTNSIKDPIIDRFKLMEIYQSKLRSGAYNALNRNVNVSSGKKDGVITISVDDKDPKRAAAIANAYVEELGNMTLRLNLAGAKDNRSFLEGRLSAAKNDLANAEDALKAFQQKNKAVSVTDQAQASIQVVAALKSQLISAEVQLNTLRSQLTDSSSEVKNVKATISNLRSQIAGLEANHLKSSIPSIGSIPELGQEYVRLLRNFKVQEALVETLTKQYEMVKLTESKDVSPIQVIQKATVPEQKSKPVRSKLVLLGGLAGFFISMVYVFLRESISRIGEEDQRRWNEIKTSFSFWRS